jgi:hypothetical protein
MLERNSSRPIITNPLPGLLLIAIHPHELSIELKTEESEEGEVGFQERERETSRERRSI